MTRHIRRIGRRFNRAFADLSLLERDVNQATHDEQDERGHPIGNRIVWAVHYLTQAKLCFKEWKQEQEE